MGANLRGGIEQPVERRRRALHAGIMQHQHVDRPNVGRFAPAAVVGREPLSDVESGRAGEDRGAGAHPSRSITKPRSFPPDHVMANLPATPLGMRTWPAGTPRRTTRATRRSCAAWTGPSTTP